MKAKRKAKANPADVEERRTREFAAALEKLQRRFRRVLFVSGFDLTPDGRLVPRLSVRPIP